jgi:hypothetical protein
LTASASTVVIEDLTATNNYAGEGGVLYSEGATSANMSSVQAADNSATTVREIRLTAKLFFFNASHELP